MGTLLAFTTVAVSVLILRYVPPHEVPIPPSLPELIDSISLDFSNDSQEISRESTKDPFRRPLIQKEIAQGMLLFLILDSNRYYFRARLNKFSVLMYISG